jgi:GT2 family glycosyltransferase
MAGTKRVEVYVLNYNGVEFLEACIEALLALDVSGYDVGLNIVDNASTDGSQTLVSRYPGVHWIGLPNNGGFSAGNNAGVWIRRKELRDEGIKPFAHVFLNNDTVVDRDWLRKAVDVFEDPTVGIVGSKAVFTHPFAEIRFELDHSGIDDKDKLGAILLAEPIGDNLFALEKGSRYYGFGQPCNGMTPLGAESRLLMAPMDPEKPSELGFAVRNPHLEDEPLTIRAYGGADYRLLGSLILPSKGVGRFHLSFQPCDYVQVIQNAGNFVLENLECGDRGYEERDLGQFETQEEVDAICGVSLFIRDDLFVKLSGFDERFFAYYEDADLSLRARLLGLKCVYNPQSKLRHVHGGSAGGEFSDYKRKQVVYSRLLFKSKYLNEEGWVQAKKELAPLALNERGQYAIDHNLSNKPNYRASLRMRKYAWMFAMNRMRSKEAWKLVHKGRPARFEQGAT